MSAITQSQQNAQDIGNIQFLKDAEQIFLDMGSSTLDRMNFVQGQIKDGKLNEAQMLAIQELSQKRNQIFTFMANLSRGVHDTVMRIVGNIGR